jgi:hypothetical protein
MNIEGVRKTFDIITKSLPEKSLSGRNGCGGERTLVMRLFESVNSLNTMSDLQKIFDILNFSSFGTCGTFTESEYNPCMN